MSSAILQAGVNAVTGPLNNLMAAKRERTARKENYQYNEKAANNADARTRALYKDLYSPQAQMQQIQEAGLSPSIFASGGMAGKSGVSGAQGAGASGISPQTYGISPIDIAHIELTKAQTEKVKAEKDTITGDNERGMAEIKKLLAESTSMEVANKYTESLTKTNEWKNYITSSTANYSIREAAYRSEQAAYDMQNTYWKAANEKKNFEFNEATFNTRVEKEKQTWVNLQLDALLKQSQTELNEEQRNLVKGELSMLYDTSMREWAKIDVQRADQEKRAELIDKEVANFERKLEQTDKQLRISNRTSWFNNINSSIRTIAYSASCVASFLPTSGGTPIPPVLEPSGINQYY